MDKPIKNYLKKNNLTRDEFAESLGINKIYLNTIIAGLKLPSLKLLLKISEITDISTDELIAFYNKKQGAKNGKL